jgi:hypothetical protein
MQRWKRTTIANQLMVIATAIVALGTLFYVGIAFLGYVESRKARHAAEEDLVESVEENILIQSSRFTGKFETEVLHHVSVSRTMPSPLFARAFWVVTVINNDTRDISICEYSIKPLSQNLPGSGPYGQRYEQGLFDLNTDEPLHLPIALAAGHAIRFKVCSFLVILPYIGIKHEGSWLQGPPSGKIDFFRFFYDYFASQGIDFFGNEVSPGPGGIQPINNSNIINQELSFLIRSGRGTTQTETLTWYDIDTDK